MSLLASDTSELHLEDIHLPDNALLPESSGLKSPLMCLTQARFGITFGAVGAAMGLLRRSQELFERATDVR